MAKLGYKPRQWTPQSGPLTPALPAWARLGALRDHPVPAVKTLRPEFTQLTGGKEAWALLSYLLGPALFPETASVVLFCGDGGL